MSDVLKVFIGFDERQNIAYSVLQHSLFTRSTKPLAITPLVLSQLPLKRQGLTPFTFSRFLVPYLCNFEGWALFMDIDILVLDDITKLFKFADDSKAVMVSKNDKRFEWASVMLFNCSHPANKVLTPSFIEDSQGLHTINWCGEDLVGEFPGNFNFLVGYDEFRPNQSIVHYTQGVPCHKGYTEDCEYSKEWLAEHQLMNSSLSWPELMGQSVHACIIDGKLQPKYKAARYEQSVAVNV